MSKIEYQRGMHPISLIADHSYMNKRKIIRKKNVKNT